MLCVAGLLSYAKAEALGQQPAGAVPAGAVPAGPMTPEQMKQMQEARAAAAAGQQPGGPPKPGDKPDEKGKKPGEGGDKKPEGGGGDSVKRPDTPPKPADPNELKVTLDAQGKVPAFNFIGQPWPHVMQWLANLSKASLDWQELPNGYLNLTTQRSYSLDEVHDLINQALNARGYTSIQTGEVLSVFKLDKLDPSVVRQVHEEDLYNLKRYDYVKVSFELPTEMEVDKAKDDVKQILSPNAKVFPLVTTRRLLIMDSVANLRTVSELFNQERMIKSGRIVPKEFVLKYARPEHVIEVLKTMVGADTAGAKPAMTPEQMQQQQQMMQQMQQQGQNPRKVAPPTDAPKVYMAMNRRRNSVLVNAPPEQMKIIEQTIDYMDVPFGDEEAPAVGVEERALIKYQLVTMDPEQLKLTLEEIGELDARTELRADNKSKILFARATSADHKKIAALRDELDGTGRKLYVFWLPRHLPADAVAGTVMALMGGQEQEEKSNNDYPFFYYSYRNRSNDDDKPKKGFRVDADIENNRLLAWANEAESKEVQRFLDELGRSAPTEVSNRTVRTLDASDPEATKRLLEQLRTAWPALGGNELIINDQRVKKPAPAATEEEKKPEPTAQPKDDRAAKSSGTANILAAAATTSSRPRFRLVQATTKTAAATPSTVVAEAAPSAVSESKTESTPAAADEQSAAPETAPPAAKSRPPITITITEDGRMLVSSADTVALDRFEQFVGEVSPPTQRYKIFPIKYVDVFDVYLNLKEFYEEELKGENEAILDWWGDVRSSEKKSGSLLSKRPKLRLIWDPPSNSILVANASSRQLTEIEDLIKAYDKPTADDATTERVTQPIKIKYSRASTIVAAVKEVFRDLLSSKDKEFDAAKEGKGGSTGSSGSGVTILSYSRNSGSSNDTKRSAPVKVGFQGALSLGADDVSNIVLVSAQREVFEGVVEMIEQLDEESAPRTTVQVHRVAGNVGAESLQKALEKAVGTAWLGNRPEPSGTSAQGQPRSENNDRDRDRSDRSRRRGRDND